MAAFFIDTSALVKRYVRETGSAWLTAMTDHSARNSCWLSTMTAVELVAALYRRTKTGTLPPHQALAGELTFRSEFASQFHTVAVSTTIIQRAMALAAKHTLRGYDALQLATCLTVRDRRVAVRRPLPTLISSDQELNQAAAAESLLVDDPNLHP